MILKAGTYRFNDTTTELVSGTYLINSTINGSFGTPISWECEAIVSKGSSWGVNVDGSYREIYYSSGWLLDESPTNTIPTDTEVDDTFGTWYIANTNYNEVNASKMTLKAGTYRFNGELNFDTIPFEYFESADTYLYQQNANYQFDENTKFQIFSFGKYPIENGYVTVFSYQTSIDLGATSNEIVNVYSSDEGLGLPKGWAGELYEMPNEALQTHTLTQDTEVADEFGEWYISSTDYNEVNGIVTKPIATITYNGETIAQLNAGDKATIPCSQYNMSKDLVFKVNEVESKIPEGYIKPEGSLSITENGTYPVTDKEEVVVNVPTTTDGVPVEMLNQAVMNELIAPNSTKGEVGAVYLYHGEASDTYEYDALYILEEVSE